jgi:hypothetical protein
MPSIALNQTTANATSTLSTASINSVFQASVASAVGSTANTFATGQKDLYSFVNGNGPACATAVVDPSIVVASNSTTITLSTLTTTGGGSWAFTALKGLRLYNAPTNDNLTITSNITGFPACKLPPGSFLVFGSEAANGITVTGANTITANGTNGNVAVITMILS